VEEVAEVVAAELRPFLLDREVVLGELLGLVVGERAVVRRVVGDQLREPVVHNFHRRRVLIVERPELCRLTVGERQVHGHQGLAVGTDGVAQDVEVGGRRFVGGESRAGAEQRYDEQREGAAHRRLL
jgi:hypothetical protein